MQECGGIRTHVSVFIIAEKSFQLEKAVAIVRYSPIYAQMRILPLLSKTPAVFLFSSFQCCVTLSGICFSSKNRWESATGSSLSPQRTYRDNGLILRSRNGAVVIRLCDWFVRDDGFREKRQSKCREWHTLLYSAMYRQKSMFFFVCLRLIQMTHVYHFKRMTTHGLSHYRPFFVRLTLTSFRQSWLLCATLFVSIR
jgi:hypothetical protein